MEDAHIATVQLGGAPGAAMFGVFDGHGGRYLLLLLLLDSQAYPWYRHRWIKGIVRQAAYLVSAAHVSPGSAARWQSFVKCTWLTS